MMRYLSPLLFAAATAWLWHYNDTNADTKLILPFIDVILPETAGDPAAMAEASVYGAVALTGAIFVFTVIGHIRDLWRRRVLKKALAPKPKA